MCWVGDDDTLVVGDCQPHVSLGVEGCQPHVALGKIGVLVKELVDLDDALELDSSSLKLLHEVLLVTHELASCAWLRLDLNLGGHIAPQVLELHVVVVLDVVPRHLVHLGVDALSLALHFGVVVAVLVLMQSLLGLTLSVLLRVGVT